MPKIIAESFLPALIEDIVAEKREAAEVSRKVFNGISGEELSLELNKKLGIGWAIDTKRPKLSKLDINAIANARFFRQTGRTLLMGAAIIILALAVVMKYIELTPLYTNIYYTVCGLVALGFIYIYSRKQSKMRHEMRWQLGVKDSEDKE